jgi:hypothetical protein
LLRRHLHRRLGHRLLLLRGEHLLRHRRGRARYLHRRNLHLLGRLHLRLLRLWRWLLHGLLLLLLLLRDLHRGRLHLLGRGHRLLDLLLWHLRLLGNRLCLLGDAAIGVECCEVCGESLALGLVRCACPRLLL